MDDSLKRIITLYDYSINPEVKGEFYPAQNLVKTELRAKNQELRDATPTFTKTDWVKQNYADTKKGFSLTRIFVALFLAVSMYGFITLAFPIIAAEASFRFSQYTSDPKTMSGTASPSARVKALDPEIAVQFNITIPKINLESRVIEGVDPVDELSYKDALTKGIAHAQGSYLPGQGGSVFLFAHSTNDISNILTYNAKFYAVKDLNPGDQVIINFKGRRYTYEVLSHQVVNPSDLDTIRNSNADLILSTCYPPGTDWQRLITFAKLVNTSN